jgi:hypothetical protein
MFGMESTVGKRSVALQLQVHPSNILLYEGTARPIYANFKLWIHLMLSDKAIVLKRQCIRMLPLRV